MVNERAWREGPTLPERPDQVGPCAQIATSASLVFRAEGEEEIRC
jgi:hypothetical protein